ncbi:MAG: putative ABC exporter domain-containing protein [Oscillospiraceae bacterium]
MRSLLFITRKTAKNRLLSLRRRPGLLVVYFVFLALIVASMASAAGGWGASAAGGQPLALYWLKLAFLGYVLLFAISSVSAALSTGGSIFDMADANFLFVSPVNPKQILVWGLCRQMVRSLFASVFILMMGNTLNTLWQLGLGALLAIYAGYVVALVLFQLLTVCLYMYTTHRPKIKRWVAPVCLLFLVPTLLAVLVPAAQGTPLAAALEAALNGPVLYTIPVAGWVVQAVFALMAGDAAMALLAAGLVAAAAVLIVVLLTVGKSDYYEEVLVSTERTYLRQQAVQEGNLNAMDTRRGVKVKEKSVIRGRGAAAFFGKHLLEDTRRNRLVFLDASSLAAILTAVIMAFLLRNAEGALVSVLITVMSMRTILVGTSQGLKELYSHYIFMVPASSFAKMVWSNMEACLKGLVESAVAFGAAAVILDAPLGQTLLCILCAALFTALLVSVNLLSMRLFTNVISQGLLITIYFMFIVLVMAPGIVAAVLCAALVEGGAGMLLGLGALCAWQVLLAALFFFLSRGVLHSCDMESASAAPRK